MLHEAELLLYSQSFGASTSSGNCCSLMVVYRDDEYGRLG